MREKIVEQVLTVEFELVAYAMLVVQRRASNCDDRVDRVSGSSLHGA